MDHNQNNHKENEYLFKVLIIGDVAVGKSCILKRFAENVFDSKYGSTIGVDFKAKKLNLRGKSVKLQIWDTAGHERFRSMTSAFYRGAHGIVLVYDVTRMETFTNIPKWLKELDLQDCNCTVKILFGNKSDLSIERTVPREMAFKYADAHNMFLFETSAKTGDSVHEAFEHLVSRMLILFHEKETSPKKPPCSAGVLPTCILSGQENVAQSSCSC
ncbi:ras-like GTP-binding protein YPT1 [Dendronephthya gigantea]|uniref:ras-like GTP-binding protein YPT1 n=1 Tax=Dendronephthya gigantea TaxID=151771 RepID=UPI001068DF20|nr:ras-like GTP-binding protein YPT1 [Dendronephthya gigantea]